MVHPFAWTRYYYQANAPAELDAVADRLSQRLAEIGVPDHVLAYMIRNMASPVGIHVAIARYEPSRLVELLAANQKLKDGEDLDYFAGQGMNEDEIAATLEEQIFELLTEAAIPENGSTPKHLDEDLGSGRWAVTKIIRGGVYDSDDLSDAEIITELRRYW